MSSIEEEEVLTIEYIGEVRRSQRCIDESLVEQSIAFGG